MSTSGHPVRHSILLCNQLHSQTYIHCKFLCLAEASTCHLANKLMPHASVAIQPYENTGCGRS